MILDDFNVRSKSWWNGDITSKKGSQIGLLKTSFALQQRISDLTYILSNSFTCIDLIFIDQPNLTIERGVHLSLHTCTSSPNNILQVQFHEYPPLYECLVWDCNKACINSIKQALHRSIGLHFIKQRCSSTG